MIVSPALLISLKNTRQWIYGIHIGAISWLAKFAGSVNSLNFRLIYTATSSCMSHRYITYTVLKLKFMFHFYHQTSFYSSFPPSQHHQSSTWSSQNQIHPGLLFLIFIQSILSPTCLSYTYTLLSKPRPQTITNFLHIFLQSVLHVTVSATLLQQI